MAGADEFPKPILNELKRDGTTQIDRLDSVYLPVPSFGRLAMPWWMIFKTRSRSSPESGSLGSRTLSEPKPASCAASLYTAQISHGYRVLAKDKTTCTIRVLHPIYP